MTTARARYARAADDLRYLPEVRKGRKLSAAQAQRWTAYLHSKYTDDGRLLSEAQLLAKVVQRFDADPSFARYPKWLRYAVINFSGMRYASAHGSYADASGLVRHLATDATTAHVRAESEDEIAAEANKTEAEISASVADLKPAAAAKAKARLDALRAVEIARAKAFARPEDLAVFDELEAAQKARASLDTGDPAQAKRRDELDAIISAKTAVLGVASVKKAEQAIAKAEAARRAAVLDSTLTKTAADLAALDDAHALAVLEKMHSAGSIPDWVWRRIVRVTLLRAKYAGADWETPSAEERAAETSKDPVTARWRSLLRTWMAGIDVTSWRERNARDLALVMIRAECNEISETIQHARGEREIAGGISAKATWYADTSKGRSFARPKTASELTPGATLFWAKWSTKKPESHDRVVPNPAFELREESGAAIVDGATIGDSIYHIDAEHNVVRERQISTPVDPSQPPERLTEYLLWMHEATVVEVDNAKGRVLTFETADPTSLSVRAIASIVGQWNVFIGYAPPGTEPATLDALTKRAAPTP